MINEPKPNALRPHDLEQEKLAPEPPVEGKRKVAIACQGGGIHAAFEVGVLSELLDDIQRNPDRFELIGLSGTSAGALCALMVWYGLAPKRIGGGSTRDAIQCLNNFWDTFAATTTSEKMINLFAYSAFIEEEQEIRALGVNAPVFSLNPGGAIMKGITRLLPLVRVRREYFDLDTLLAKSCPSFEEIDWQNLTTRLLVGSSEIVNGIETVFDSDLKMPHQGGKHTKPLQVTKRWRERLPLSLAGVAASGALPRFLESREIAQRCYWDGLYSQNPPIREFVAEMNLEHIPDEIWVVRINPQQCRQRPQSNAEIQDRQHQLMGNLSLNKELDFIAKVNLLLTVPQTRAAMAARYKHVTVRTIMMMEGTATKLLYSSKFNRSRWLIDQLRTEGHEVARDWLNRWPNVGTWPEDAAYWPQYRVY